MAFIAMPGINVPMYMHMSKKVVQLLGRKVLDACYYQMIKIAILVSIIEENIGNYIKNVCACKSCILRSH